MARRLRPQVLGVPPEFADDLQAASFASGVPQSWLAAVCEMTGWNPYFQTLNIPSGTLRRFGIAGVWARLEETIISADDVGLVGTGFGDNCTWAYAGNFAGGFEGTLDTAYCNICHGDPDAYRSVADNVMLAAELLNEADHAIQNLCGERNSLIFLRWMLGCHWLPWDVVLGEARCDVLPPGIPNIFVNEVQTLVDVQALYAEDYAEVPIVPPGPPGPPGPGGVGTGAIALLGLLGIFGLVGLGAAKKKGR